MVLQLGHDSLAHQSLVFYPLGVNGVPPLNWGSVLAFIFPYYTSVDLLVMTEAMNRLPSTIGTGPARKSLENITYVAYWKETGLDLTIGKPPAPDWLEWVCTFKYN